MIFPIITFLFALGFADARPQCDGHRAVSCPSGFHIVGVRGTLEAVGHGALKEIVDRLEEMYPDSDDFPIVYPAEGVKLPKNPGDKPEMNLLDYQQSEFIDTQILLLGYSQGAHIVGDVLCGNKNILGGVFKRPIDSDYTENIKGVVTLGDPANNNAAPWHEGNGSYSGMFKRFDYSSCSDLLTDYGQSWCDEKDFFCEFLKWGTEGSIAVHLKYVSEHKEQILAQIKKHIDDHKEKEEVDVSKFLLQGIDL